MVLTCLACGSVNIAEHDNGLSCTSCGYMVSESNIVNEIGFQDSANGASTVVGQFVPSSGPRTLSMGGGRGMPQGHSRNSRETTILKGKQSISRIAQQIPNLQQQNTVIESALKLYQHAVEHKFIQGRKTDSVAAACLYIACRRSGTNNQLLIDFSDVLQINVFTLGNIVTRYVRKMQTRMPLTDPSLYMDRFANELELGDHSYRVASTALRVLSHMRRDWLLTGRRPSGLCGACLLVATRVHNFSRSETEIARVVRVGEATLRKRIDEFKDAGASSLTADELGDQLRPDLRAVAPGIAHAPPAFLRHEESADRRRRLRALIQQRPNLARILELSTTATTAAQTAASNAAEAARAAVLAAPATAGLLTGPGAVTDVDSLANPLDQLAGLDPTALMHNAGATAVAGPTAAARAAAASDAAAAAAAAAASAAASTEATEEDLEDVVRQIQAVLKAFPMLRELAGDLNAAAAAGAGAATAAAAASPAGAIAASAHVGAGAGPQALVVSDIYSKQPQRARHLASAAATVAVAGSRNDYDDDAGGDGDGGPWDRRKVSRLRTVLGLGDMADEDIAALIEHVDTSHPVSAAGAASQVLTAEEAGAVNAAALLQPLPGDRPLSDTVDVTFAARERRRLAEQEAAHIVAMARLQADLEAYRLEETREGLDDLDDDAGVDDMIGDKEEIRTRSRLWLRLNEGFLREKERRKRADEQQGIVRVAGGSRKRGPRPPERSVADRVNIDVFRHLQQEQGDGAFGAGSSLGIFSPLSGDVPGAFAAGVGVGPGPALAADADADVDADAESSGDDEEEEAVERRRRRAATDGAPPSAAGPAAASELFSGPSFSAGATSASVGSGPAGAGAAARKPNDYISIMGLPPRQRKPTSGPGSGPVARRADPASSAYTPVPPVVDPVVAATARAAAEAAAAAVAETDSAAVPTRGVRFHLDASQAPPPSQFTFSQPSQSQADVALPAPAPAPAPAAVPAPARSVNAVLASVVGGNRPKNKAPTGPVAKAPAKRSRQDE
jgi:transcription initiation factor TFIIIB Brf1 subunit/transcription initiation factor TFIIB